MMRDAITAKIFWIMASLAAGPLRGDGCGRGQGARHYCGARGRFHRARPQRQSSTVRE